MFIRRSTDPSHRAPRGQALAEFAMILPILLALVGAGVDFARGYAAQMTLQTAARNAAEAVAFDPAVTTGAQAQAKAQSVVCTEAQRLPGFVPGTGGDVATCTQPAVTATWTKSATAPGAKDPLVTVTVTTTLAFDTTIPWPLLPDGAWTLGTTESFSIIQGR